MKKFQALRESVYSPNGINIPDATDGLDAVGIYSIENPEVLARLNSVVQACFSTPCNNVKQRMAELRGKLNIAGIDLDLSDFMAVEGEHKIPLNRFGGRYGWDAEKGTVTSDDGIEPFAGYKMCLYVTITLDNYSFYRIEGYIAPSTEEETPELGESVELDEAGDPRIGKMSDKGKKLLASLANVMDTTGGPYLDDKNVKFLTKKGVDATIKAADKAKLGGPGQRYLALVKKELGESVELDEKPYFDMNKKRKFNVPNTKRLGADFTKAKDALVAAGIPNMGEKNASPPKLKVHTKFKKKAEAIMKKFKGVELEINHRMPEKPMRGYKEDANAWYEAMRTCLLRTESLDEAIRVNKKDGPFTVVALKGKKVVGQIHSIEHKELKDAIAMMKAEHRGAKVSVESKGGKIVHTEAYVAEDRESARELEIYIENDAQLYKSQQLSIFKNLMAKRARGQYQSKLASKLFMYLVDNGAKKYVKEFDAPGAKWNKVFDKATRQQVADSLTRSFEAEAESGAYDNFIPKKYRTK